MIRIINRFGSCLKCLSARFVIDMPTWEDIMTEAGAGLKCLSARFVIDIWGDLMAEASAEAPVSNAFRLDS